MQAGFKVILPAALVLGGSLGFAWAYGGSSGSEDALARLEQRQDELQRQVKQLAARDCATASSPGSGESELRSAVTRAVREELQVLKVSGGSTDVVPEAPRAEPTRDNLAARDECMRLIDQAVRSREWNDAQAVRFQQLMDQLTETQRDEMMERLVAVLNGGEVRINTQGTPF